MRQRDVFSDQASIASWALFTLHRKKLYEYRNANEQNISVKMRSPEHYSVSGLFPYSFHCRWCQLVTAAEMDKTVPGT
ncbi:hypothetical protein FEU66_26670 [Escherichia coli]|nr:hypothetical protein [Escherichia coli]EFD0883077.1 hypothetical protein [Escherichia coli]